MGIRDYFWPSWVKPHPCRDVMPFHHIWFTHSKEHYNGQDHINDALCGHLTVLTQGSKCVVAVVGFVLGSTSDGWQAVYFWSLIAFLAVGLTMLAVWMRLWPSAGNCIISITAWAFYINGWTLSVLVLYRSLPAIGLPKELGLLPSLGPPMYITLRTIIFGTLKPERRLLFPLAAISNRSVPLDMGYSIVGPPATWDSHRMLVMLNTYSMSASLAAKVVTFALEWDELQLVYILLHALHLSTTVYAALYSIRCRQIAIDKWEAAHGHENPTKAEQIPRAVEASETRAV